MIYAYNGILFSFKIENTLSQLQDKPQYTKWSQTVTEHKHWFYLYKVSKVAKIRVRRKNESL